MTASFEHRALNLQDKQDLIYTALSKHLYYFRAHISKYVLEHGKVPLNPFMLFDYFLLDTIDRDRVRQANNTVVERADEIWCFGPVSNGVLAEICQAHKQGKAVRYFSIENSSTILPVSIEEVEMEEEVKTFRYMLSTKEGNHDNTPCSHTTR